MIGEWQRTQATLALAVLIGAGSFVRGREVWASNEPPVLEYDVSGSGPGADGFLHAIEKRSVQTLLLDVAAAPRDRAFLDAALADSGVSADRLEALGLVHLSDGRYQLSFSLLTLEDRQRIQTAAETEGRRLASMLLEERSTIERIVRSGNMPTADWRATAFFILGCVSLDWDGLNWLEENGPPRRIVAAERRRPPGRSRRASRALPRTSFADARQRSCSPFAMDRRALPRCLPLSVLTRRMSRTYSVF